jgi:hypothetical protein
MTTKHNSPHYRATESKYKGGAREMYVTYDLEQETRSGRRALYPKVKRVYVAGDVKDWQSGSIKKRSGRRVHGVLIEYEQTRRGYQRKAYAALRGTTAYRVEQASVGPTKQTFKKVVEVPEKARNVRLFKNATRLPARYRSALQDIR